MMPPADARASAWWPRVVVLAIAVGIALRLPSLWAGFGMDDFAQLAMIGGVYPVERAPWDLFTFSSGDPAEVQRLMDRGSLAWWSDPHLRLSALRPLSSLLTWTDVRVFGHYATAHHLHSLLWWVAMMASVALLLRRLLPVRWAAVALFLYVLDESHTYPIGWLANRNAIVSATFGFLAVWAHVRWREDAWRRGAWLAPLALALALAGGEYGTCAIVWLVAYELVGAPGSARTRARALVPAAAVVIAWAAIHRGWGYGSYGSTVYVDPLREPIAWLSAAALRGPILVADMLLAIPTGKLAFEPELMRIQAWMGPLALAVVGALLPGAASRLPHAQRRTLAWLTLAAIASILPVTSSFVSARLLLIPGVAGHVVVAALVLDGWDRLRDDAARRHWLARARGLAAAALVVAHGGLATWWGIDETLSIGQLNIGTRQSSLSLQVDDARVPEQRLVVLNANDPHTLLYPPSTRWIEGHPMPRSWWVLSLAPKPHRLHRTALDAFELTVVDGAMLGGPVEQLFRRPENPMHPGDVVALDGLRIEVLEVAAGRGPTRVRYTFAQPLEHASQVFLLATRRGMIRYPMGPVGSTVTIPPAALPLPLDLATKEGL